MVKNTVGGSKTKGQARKHLTVKENVSLRISHDKDELYAQVTKMLGGAMCHVICNDNITRLCHIRGKFRGRGKRDNFIGVGTWLLVGAREWEAEKDSTKGKFQNCDVIEVYNDLDKERLKNTVTNVSWSTFIANDNKVSVSEVENEDGFIFSDRNMDEYNEIIETQISNNSTIITTDDGKLIDVDDI